MNTKLLFFQIKEENLVLVHLPQPVSSIQSSLGGGVDTGASGW